MGITLRRNSYPVKTNPFYNFDPNTGYFGQHRGGSAIDVRTVYTEGDPIEETQFLFGELTKGAHIIENEKGKRWHAVLEDGSIITLRINHPTPEHAPAVMISVRMSNDKAGVANQKIHFAKKGN